jgi:predicted O-methyltransferase YrrM
MKIQRLVIDSSDAVSELCLLGKATGTDKSPYNEVAHRHPYTAVYSLLFAPLKHQPIRFAEIGVAGGASALLWRIYFPSAEIFMFDRDQNFLDRAAQRVSPVSFRLMDVSVDGGVASALADISGELDILIDDSSHDFDHQIRIIRESVEKIRQGGMLIIEDVFRSESEQRYKDALEPFKHLFSAALFVVCEHKDRWSPGWDNDKLLVLIRG